MERGFQNLIERVCKPCAFQTAYTFIVFLIENGRYLKPSLL